MLQARIELCAMRERGELPKNSTQCDQREKKKLEAYKSELQEIEKSLVARSIPGTQHGK